MQNINAQNGLQDNGDEKKRKGKGFIIWMTIAGIAIVLALLVGLYFFLNSTQSSSRGGDLGQLDGKTADEIRAELDRIVEDGMMNISIASVIEFENGTSEGEVKIENSPANHYLMQVQLSLVDTGQVIFTSDIIEPNYHVQTATLDENLPAGNYPCIATFYALDMDTEEVVGQAAAQCTVVVRN